MTIPTWAVLSNEVVSITNANPGLVTTATPHGFRNGLYVRFFFPGNFGMSQLNGNVYLITVVSNNSFTIDTDTTALGPFTSSGSRQQPQVIPVGEQSFTLSNAEKNTEIPFGGQVIVNA